MREMVKTIENARTIALKFSETEFRNLPGVNKGLSIVRNFNFLFNRLCVMIKMMLVASRNISSSSGLLPYLFLDYLMTIILRVAESVSVSI